LENSKEVSQNSDIHKSLVSALQKKSVPYPERCARERCRNAHTQKQKSWWKKSPVEKIRNLKGLPHDIELAFYDTFV
jgi:hypothetical protein